MIPYDDHLIRGTAADGQIRFFCVSSKDTVEEARQRHGTSPVMTAALGRLLSAGLMMGAMMKGERDLLTLQIRGDGPGQGLIVSADAFGHVKGYPIVPLVLIPANKRGKLDVGGAIGKGVLSVIRDTGIGDPYSSQVNLVSREIAEDLTYYFASSEQIPSSVALGVLMNKENTVRAAGGYIIQLMPGTDEAILDALEKRLEEASPVTTYLSDGLSPEDIIAELLGCWDINISDDRLPVSFHCNCSKERTKKVLVSLGQKEIHEMISEKKPVEIHCHFCNSNYVFSVKEQEEMVSKIGAYEVESEN